MLLLARSPKLVQPQFYVRAQSPRTPTMFTCLAICNLRARAQAFTVFLWHPMALSPRWPVHRLFLMGAASFAMNQRFWQSITPSWSRAEWASMQSAISRFIPGWQAEYWQAQKA